MSRLFSHDKPYKRGAALTLTEQREAKRRYVHRYTGDHTPRWAFNPRPDGTRYMPQFANDADWLENTLFQTDARGKALDGVDCYSTPTWPHGQNVKA